MASDSAASVELARQKKLNIPVITSVSEWRVNLSDLDSHSSRHLNSPPPPVVVPKVTVVNFSDGFGPSIRVSVPPLLPRPNLSRFGRERRAPAHLATAASDEEEGKVVLRRSVIMLLFFACYSYSRTTRSY